MLWTSEEEEEEEEEGEKIDDDDRCQPHPRLQGKGGEQKLHLSCANAVDSICCEYMLWVPSLMSKCCGLHLS